MFFVKSLPQWFPDIGASLVVALNSTHRTDSNNDCLARFDKFGSYFKRLSFP